jgi:hypothetical protein
MKPQYIIIDEDGSKNYYSNKKMTILHREDGPACEFYDGNKVWYQNGKCPREDGPAIEWSDGSGWWYLNGHYHREDGPALEWTNGRKCWYLNGIEYSEVQFNKKMNPAQKININGREFTVEELNSLIAKAQ